MNNAQSLNGANINVGMTLMFDGIYSQKGNYEFLVNYREELFDGEILLKGTITRVYESGARHMQTINGVQLLKPSKKYQVLN